MVAAVRGQCVHRTAQLCHRPILAHPLLEDARQLLLIEVEIRCLQNKILNRELRIVTRLLITRGLILHADLRSWLLTRDLRARPRQRRCSIARAPYARSPRTNTRGNTRTHNSILSHTIHPITHDRLSTPIMLTLFRIHSSIFKEKRQGKRTRGGCNRSIFTVDFPRRTNIEEYTP